MNEWKDSGILPKTKQNPEHHTHYKDKKASFWELFFIDFLTVHAVQGKKKKLYNWINTMLSDTYNQRYILEECLDCKSLCKLKLFQPNSWYILSSNEFKVTVSGKYLECSNSVLFL